MPDTLSTRQRQQAALYALDALTDAERIRFEKELETNPALQSELDDNTNSLDLTKMASQVDLPEHVLEGQRNLLRGRIEQYEAEVKQSAIKTRLDNIWFSITQRIFIPRQPAWAAVSYAVVAFLIGRLAIPAVQPIATVATESTQPDVLQMLESGMLTSADIDLSQNGSESVSFNLQAKNDFSVEGGVNDEQVQQILYYMLKNDRNPGKRMKAVNLLSEAPPVEEGKVVFISSLLSDPNPGVRLRAAKSLGAYESDKTLRDACIKVLFEDENEAVRIAALGILAKNPTEDIIPALKIVTQMDKNKFIRNQAQRIADTFRGQVAVERIED